MGRKDFAPDPCRDARYVYLKRKPKRSLLNELKRMFGIQSDDYWNSLDKKDMARIISDADYEGVHDER